MILFDLSYDRGVTIFTPHRQNRFRWFSFAGSTQQKSEIGGRRE
jgi:hypothetical protein